MKETAMKPNAKQAQAPQEEPAKPKETGAKVKKAVGRPKKAASKAKKTGVKKKKTASRPGKSTTKAKKTVAHPKKAAANMPKADPKNLRECVRHLMELPAAFASDEEAQAAKAFGLAPGQITNNQMVALVLLNKAKTGDIAAIKELRNLMGDEENNGLGQWETMVLELQNEP